MPVQTMLQLPGSNEHLNQLIRTLDRSGRGADFRALVAFVRANELTAMIWNAIEKFCERGGRIDWIVGTDLGGTDPESLRRLFTIQQRNPGSRVRIMKLPGGAVFHPKFYWVSSPTQHFAIIGSANCTRGGLGSNLEVSLAIRAASRLAEFAPVGQMLKELWEAVDKPRPPLDSSSLIALDDSVIAQISVYSTAMKRVTARRPVHPLARHVRRRSQPVGLNGQYLVMELTMEQGPGRMTQVQPPRPVWKAYFHVNLENPGNLNLRLERPGSRYQMRSVVRHHHNWTVEIPEANAPRPAIVRFRRTGARRYVYRVLRPVEIDYAAAERLLQTASNPLRTGGGRRWIVV